MKTGYIYILVVITTLLATGCKRSSSNPMQYTITGLTDITAREYVDTSVVLGVGTAYTSGPQENVILTPQDLPAGVTVSPASISGIPPFGNAFTFSIFAGTAGTFPIQIAATSASTGSKTYSFDLIVSANPDCSSFITGTYSSRQTSNTDTAVVLTSSETITKDSIDVVSLPTNIGGLRTYLNCANNTLTTLPRYRPGAYNVGAGAGTYTGNSLTVVYTVSFDPTPVTTYTVTYTR